MHATRREMLSIGVGAVLASLASRAAASVEDEAAAALEKIRADHAVPGLAAAAFKNGRLALAAAAGSRSLGGDAVQTNDRWHIGSVTKPFTATLVARLVDQRRLQWEDRPSVILRCSQIHEAYKAATLEDLLSHRGGLQENIPLEALELFHSDSRSIRAQRRDYACRALGQAPTSGGPGSFAYSNNGYIVAGAVAEAKARADWETLMRRLVLRPLGLASAGFGAPLDGPVGHEPDADGKPRPARPGPRADNPRALGPAGTLHMSVIDVARFGYEHVRLAHGLSSFLSPDSVRRLHSAGGEEYSLGWYRDKFRGGPLFLHTGTNGAWFALLMAAPASNFSVAVAANAGRRLGGEKAVLATAGRIASMLFPRSAR